MVMVASTSVIGDERDGLHGDARAEGGRAVAPKCVYWPMRRTIERTGRAGQRCALLGLVRDRLIQRTHARFTVNEYCCVATWPRVVTVTVLKPVVAEVETATGTVRCVLSTT